MAYRNYKYRLTIQMYDLVPNADGGGGYHLGKRSGEAIVVERPITISFNINGTPFSGISNATIDIYNLNKNSRELIFYDYRRLDSVPAIYLEAGYEDGDFDLIFAGHATVLTSQREGVNIITHIEALSGALIADASTSLTIKEGATEEEVTKALLNSGLGVLPSTQMTFRNYAFIRPISLFGNTLKLLKEYTNGNGFVDLDKFMVLDDDQTIGKNAKVIDDRSGLLDTPKRTQSTVYFKMMFAPEIHPADAVSVHTTVEEAFNGLYKVWSVKHRGLISDGVKSDVVTQIEVCVGAQTIGRYRYDK